MKPTTNRPSPFFLATSLLFLAFSLAEPLRAGLEAGAAIVDITPEEFPVILRGAFDPKPTESAHDPLNARSLALRNGDDRVVITIVDIISIDQETCDRIKAKAAEVSGWGTPEMVLAGTHTHSAPSATGTGDEGPEAAFRKKAFDGIVESIATAISRLEPAQVGFGSDEVPEEVYNRRWYLKEGTMTPNPFGGIDVVRMNPPRNAIVKPAGPTDPEVAVINVRKANGSPLGLLANYALHYVGGVPGRGVSADYFGEFARVVPYRIAGSSPPEDFVAMLSNGTSGDINNSDFPGKRAPRSPFEQIRQVAGKVADASWRALKEAEYDPDPALAMVERRVKLDYRKPDDAMVAEAHRVLGLTREEQNKLPRLAVHYAARTLRAAENPDSVEVVVQALRIGDQCIVTMPFEVLVEIGLELKEASPFPRTMIIELANGSFGYLPPPNQHELGGYETWLGTNRVQKEASVILTRELLEMLGELKG